MYVHTCVIKCCMYLLSRCLVVAVWEMEYKGLIACTYVDMYICTHALRSGRCVVLARSGSRSMYEQIITYAGVENSA